MDPGVPIELLPREWQRHITQLRKDCKRYRLTVRELEAENANLKALTDGK